MRGRSIYLVILFRSLSALLLLLTLSVPGSRLPLDVTKIATRRSVGERLVGVQKVAGTAVSPLREKDRTGSVIHDMIFAWAFAEVNGFKYLGPVGARKDLADLDDFFTSFMLPFSRLDRIPDNSTMLNPNTYRNETVLSQGIQTVRQRISQGTSHSSSSCAVHVRRGDVSETMKQAGDYFRWLPAVYYLRMIDEYCDGSSSVIICAERLGEEDRNTFASFGYDIRDNQSVLESLKDLSAAQTLIMSASSFSYTAALFAKGNVVYVPFWHKPLPSWIIPTRSLATDWDNVTLSFKTETLPCVGGSAGRTDGPAMSVCIISPNTSIAFQNPLNAAQIMYNCWSIFQHHGSFKCALNFEELEPSDFSVWLAHRLGCAVQVKAERCCHISTFIRDLSMGPEKIFSWFNTVSDAIRMSETVLRHLRAPSSKVGSQIGLGIIHARGSEKLVLPQTAVNTGARVTYIEDLTYDEQASWWNKHEVILSAGGGKGIWAVPFAQSCTAVIQVFPDQYYPFYSYEQLIFESGSVPISWWPGADIIEGLFETARPKNATLESRVYQQSSRDDGEINISEREWNTLYALALKQRCKCMTSSYGTR